jgi:hypothetical protein
MLKYLPAYGWVWYEPFISRFTGKTLYHAKLISYTWCSCPTYYNDPKYTYQGPGASELTSSNSFQN